MITDRIGLHSVLIPLLIVITITIIDIFTIIVIINIIIIDLCHQHQPHSSNISEHKIY